MKISKRIQLYFSLLAIACFSVFGFIYYQVSSNNALKISRQIIQRDSAYMLRVVETSYNRYLSDLKKHSLLINEFFKRDFKIDSNQKFTIKDNDGNQIELPEMKIRQKYVKNDMEMVRQLKKTFNYDLSFFQKTGDRFICVLSGINTAKGHRKKGYYIPKTSKIYQALIKGDFFQGQVGAIGNRAIAHYSPIFVDGKIVGAYSLSIGQYDLKNLRKEILNLQMMKQYVPLLIDKSGNVIASPVMQGKNIFNVLKGESLKTIQRAHHKKQGFAEIEVRNPKEPNKKIKMMLHYRSFAKMNWVVVSAVDINFVFGHIKKIIYGIIGLVIIVLILFIIFSRRVAASIVRPLLKVIESMKDISEGKGDLTQEIPIIRKDEVGELILYVNNFTRRMREIIIKLRDTISQLQYASTKMQDNSRSSVQSLHALSSTIETIQEKMRDEKNMIQESSDKVWKIIDDINTIFKMSESMEEQLFQSSSAIEEMVASIKSTSDMAESAHRESEKLTGVSEQGSKSMQSLGRSINEMAGHSEKIQEMVQLIMDLSEQTNLLAMNAAIEAAHAGEYGKGFAVVAEEIRKLADKSNQGAREIQTVVSEIQESTTKNLQEAQENTHNFLTFKEQTAQMSRVNREILSAMQEQQKANEVVLESTEILKNTGMDIAHKTKEETEEGKRVGEHLLQLNKISEEVEKAMGEQTAELEKINTISEYIESISRDMQGIAEQIGEGFEDYQTGEIQLF